MPRLKELIYVLEQHAPTFLAEKWDHVGLVIGDVEQEINKVMCALDLNEAVVEEAIQNKVQCIITHHPFFFKPIDHIDFSTEKGRIIKSVIEHQLAIYTMHTNYDIAFGGLNDYLAKGLGISKPEVLMPTYEVPLYKCVVYVPKTHASQVREVIVKQNKVKLGNYSGCTFSMQGEGTFTPDLGSQPYKGQIGQNTCADELAIGFMAYKDEIKDLMTAIKAVHPYEEVAYDVFKLEHLKKVYGLGRYGMLEQPITLEDYIEKVKAFLGIEHLRVTTQDLSRQVQKVALCSGEGSDCIKRASQVADVFITGDMKFHQAQLAQSLGLCILDVGHYASENCALVPIQTWINTAFNACEVILSSVNGETLFFR